MSQLFASSGQSIGVSTSASVLSMNVLCLVSQSCWTFATNPTDCSLPGFSVHGILQARILDWVVMPSSRGSSYPGIEPRYPALQAASLQSSHQGSPFNEYSGLISFRIDWLNLLAVQGILKSLLQYHNSKVSIIQHSVFLKAQLTWPYKTNEPETKLFLLFLILWTFKNYSNLNIK